MPYWGGGNSLDRKVDAQSLCRAISLPRRAQAAQPFDKERILRKRLRLVDQGVQDLVITRCRHLEFVTDRLLLGTGELPPLSLEGQDLGVPGAQLAKRLPTLRLTRSDDHRLIVDRNHIDVIRCTTRFDIN
jgi:hypothetical protein